MLAPAVVKHLAGDQITPSPMAVWRWVLAESPLCTPECRGYRQTQAGLQYTSAAEERPLSPGPAPLAFLNRYEEGWSLRLLSRLSAAAA